MDTFKDNMIEKLSEENLGTILRALFPDQLIQSQFGVKHDGFRMRIDYAIGNSMLVEFDGPTHYCDSKTQLRDIALKDYCEVNSIKLVRIPYFVQLNSVEIKHFFELESAAICNYESGFHDKKIIFPGNYNAHGVRLFNSQLDSYPSELKLMISDSLCRQIDSGIDKRIVFGIC